MRRQVIIPAISVCSLALGAIAILWLIGSYDAPGYAGAIPNHVSVGSQFQISKH
jgi:hypothetical protein